MVTEVIMPKLGQTMEEGVIEKWVKQEGDRVEKGDILLEITTDKATLEVESYGSGILRKVLAEEGETVPVTQVIAFIADEGEELPEISQKPVAEAAISDSKPSAETVAKEVKPVAASTSAPGGRVKASPLAKKLAKEKGVELSTIKGTGPGGRITKEDVLEAAQGSKPAAGVEEGAVPLSPMRKAIAEAMSESKRSAPHYYLTIEVDMSEVVKLRKELLPEIEKTAAVKLSFSHLLIQALAKALGEFPAFSLRWSDAGIISGTDVNVGVAVGLEDGLIVPVLKTADKKSLAEIASEVNRLIAGAREKKLKADEFTGGTFTISNLGMFDIDSFLPIINLPETAILGVGAIQKKPVAVDGKVEIRDLMKLALSIDHRVIDGALAAQFLQRLKKILEQAEIG